MIVAFRQHSSTAWDRATPQTARIALFGTGNPKSRHGILHVLIMGEVVVGTRIFKIPRVVKCGLSDLGLERDWSSGIKKSDKPCTSPVPDTEGKIRARIYSSGSI